VINRITAIALPLALCGANAHDYSQPQSADGDAPPIRDAQHNRLAFVQAACGGCHAVESPGLSPNPASPTFADIANRKGLTRESLVSWLTNAHNYPEVMDFDLDPTQVEDVADHILTLKEADYRPVPQ